MNKLPILVIALISGGCGNVPLDCHPPYLLMQNEAMGCTTENMLLKLTHEYAKADRMYQGALTGQCIPYHKDDLVRIVTEYYHDLDKRLPEPVFGNLIYVQDATDNPRAATYVWMEDVCPKL